MSMARAAVSSDWDIDAIVTAAGGVPGTAGSGVFNGELIIPGVEQSALDAAIAASDKTAILKRSLTAYADRKFAAAEAVEVPVALGGGRTALASAGVAGRTDVLGLKAKAAAGLTLTWYQSTGNLTLTSGEVDQIATAIDAHYEAALAAWQAAAAGIAAGAITTTAQVDAAFA